MKAPFFSRCQGKDRLKTEQIRLEVTRVGGVPPKVVAGKEREKIDSYDDPKSRL